MVRALVLLAAVLATFVLIVTASADPADQTWINGFWDDDDQDNAVIALLSIPCWIAPADPCLVTFLTTDPIVMGAKAPEIATPWFFVVESRGPPIARCTSPNISSTPERHTVIA